MATDRQIAANRRNSALSTGPKTEAGKIRSRANAITHGMAGTSAEVLGSASAEFLDRRTKWAAEFQPEGEFAGWALDKAVAASIRIDLCERAMFGVVEAHRQRAELAWDQDRAVEAATTFGRLGKDPLLSSRQLETSRAGVELLLNAWQVLAAPLRHSVDWSEAEASRALDLLGIAPEARAWLSPIEAPDGSDAIAYRQALVVDEVERLEALRDEVMTPLDDLHRDSAMAGDLAILDRPARLVRRYERDAWKQHRESLRVLKNPSPPPSPVVEAVAVVEAAPTPVDDPLPPFPDEWRSLREQAARVLAGHPEAVEWAEDQAEDEWLDGIERSLLGRGRSQVPERSQSGRDSSTGHSVS